MAKAQKVKKKVKKTVVNVIAHIHSSFNNTVITISEINGNVLKWASAGTAGYKGSRKSTPFAAQQAADELMTNVIEQFGVKEVDIRVGGPGQGRHPAVEAIIRKDVKIGSITDVTPLPHNGCRPPKKRSV
jgi:small subunit ribosomal protein S11